MSTNPQHTALPEQSTDWKRRAMAAEKTVDVLKKKVKSMYNKGSESVLYRQLDRARKREEQSLQRREWMEIRSAELQRYNEQLECEVLRRTQALQAILDHVTFGFLICDQELRLKEGFTRSCAELFGRCVAAGESLGALLGIEDSVSFSDFLLGMDQVFEDILPEEVSLAQLPSRFEVRGRILRIEGRVLRAVSGEVDGVLMTISDITALEEAQRGHLRNQALLTILRQKYAFEQFLTDAKEQIAQMLSPTTTQAFRRRALHTIKGNAASYGIAEVVACVHTAEEAKEITNQEILRVESSLREFIEENACVIGLHYDEFDPPFEISKQQMQAMRMTLYDDRRSSGTRIQALKHLAEEWVQRPARELLGPLQSFVEKLSLRLGKRIEFVLEGEELLVDAETVQPLFLVLPHLLRNAVDHGIEFPESRGTKSQQGRVLLSLSYAGERYRVVVEDDGGGIPIERLCRRALAQGILREEQLAKMSNEQKLALIFEDGLSSAEEATEISGRGMGMSAVQKAVSHQGGQISIQSAPAQGTRVVIECPSRFADKRPAAETVEGVRDGR